MLCVYYWWCLIVLINKEFNINILFNFQDKNVIFKVVKIVVKIRQIQMLQK